MKKLSPNKGIMTLLSVLIIGAIGLTVAVSAMLIGINSSKNSFTILQSNQSKMLANACAEDALQQIRNFTPFAGNGNLLLTYGNCSYTVVDDGAENRTVTATGTAGSIIRKVKIIINQINPEINIASWQEVADF